MNKTEAILVGVIAGGVLGAGVGYIISAKNHGTEGVRAGAVLTTLGAALSAIGGTMLLTDKHSAVALPK